MVHLILQYSSPANIFFASPVRLFIFHPFLDIKIEDVPWYISYYFPLRIFVSLSCALMYFSTPSQKAEDVPWYISYCFPPANLFRLLCAYLFFHPFPDIKIEGVPWYISYYSPLQIFFSLSCALIYFSTLSRKIEGVPR